jgi:membrane protein DedA with SNARE-associated domain
MKEKYPRFRFLMVNLGKGLIWFAFIAGAYILFMELVYKNNPEVWLERLYSKPIQIYSIYFASEFFFGIIPPEFFMIWALHKASTAHYFLNVAFFGLVSYAAGAAMFFIGKILAKRIFFRYLQKKFLSSLFPQVRKFGLFLIFVAALTPLPYSATSLVVGSSGYSTRYYLLAAISRLLRFGVYGYIIYQSHNM